MSIKTERLCENRWRRYRRQCSSPERAATFEAGDQEEDRSGREQNKATEESLKASIARNKNGKDKGHAHRHERAPSLSHTRLRFALEGLFPGRWQRRCRLRRFLGDRRPSSPATVVGESLHSSAGRAGLVKTNLNALYSASKARRIPTPRACLVKEAMRRQRKHMHSEPSRADKSIRCRVRPPTARSSLASPKRSARGLLIDAARSLQSHFLITQTDADNAPKIMRRQIVDDEIMVCTDGVVAQAVIS